MGINEQLSSLYAVHWDRLHSELSLLDRELYTNPFLIKVDEQKLAAAKFKVMIFGQETYGWFDREVGILLSISRLMDGYCGFFLDESYLKGYLGSSFFNGFKFFKNNILKYKGLEESEVVFIYNNISKIGKGYLVDAKTGGKIPQKGVSDKVRKIERDFFPVVAREIDIIKPDLIIFMTGPNRDGDIKFHLPDIVDPLLATDTDSPSRALAIVKAERHTFKAIRVYHPSFFKGFNNKLKNNAMVTIIKLLD